MSLESDGGIAGREERGVLLMGGSRRNLDGDGMDIGERAQMLVGGVSVSIPMRPCDNRNSHSPGQSFLSHPSFDLPQQCGTAIL